MMKEEEMEEQKIDIDTCLLPVVSEEDPLAR